MSRNVIDVAALGGDRAAVEFASDLLEASTEYSIIAVDRRGRIVLWNEGARRYYEYERNEAVGRMTFADLLTPEDRKAGQPEAVLESALAEGKWEGAVERVRKSGEVFTAHAVVTPRIDDKGRAVGFLVISKDISPEVRISQELRKLQVYTRSLIESNLDALMAMDPLGVITDVNHQTEVLTGRDRETLIGSRFNAYFTDPARANDAMRLVVRDGTVTNFELSARHVSGRETEVSFNAVVFRDDKGAMTGVLASARDITEQKELEVRLRTSDSYYRGLVETSAQALVAMDEAGLISDVNEEMCRMTGMPRPALIGAPFAARFADRAQATAAVQTTVEQGRVDNRVLRLAPVDGHETQAAVTLSVYKDDAGNAAGVFASVRDITEQAELEQRLRDTQTYTRSLVEANLDAMMTTDTLGIISDVNHEMEKLTGFPRKELIGTAFSGYFTDPDLADEAIRRVLQQERVTDFELTARHRDGHETLVSYNAVVFYDEQHRVRGVFASARDVTERQRFEQELQEKNVELEQADRAKDVFLAHMSHELRTPLNSVIGFTGTLLMGIPGDLNDEQRRQLLLVQDSARHLLSIINDMLDLAKIQSGKRELKREQIDLVALVDETVQSLQPQAHAKGLELIADRPDREVLTTSDRRSIQQILINLVNNAIKFTQAGQVRVTLVPGSGSPHRISVSDTGPGIAEENLERIFEPFMRSEGVTTPRAEGTGLGLSISRQLAELLGATLTVESRIGEGSTFTLTHPE